VAHGARVIFPIEDRFYGHREGRVVDPFCHVWILSKVVRHMRPEEIERALVAFKGSGQRIDTPCGSARHLDGLAVVAV
jgi:hypothetical protein